MRRENEARNCAVGESGAGRGRRVMREGRQMQDLFIGVSCLAWYGAVTGEKKCISRCPLRTDRRTDRQRQTDRERETYRLEGRNSKQTGQRRDVRRMDSGRTPVSHEI